MIDFDQVKEHIRRHKVVYTASTIVIISGISFYIGIRIGSPSISVAPVFNNMPTFNNVNLGGHMTKMVKRMSDGAMWETVTDAAKDAGCSVSFMSRHLNGHHPNVYNEIYKIVGVGTRN